jgi:uncharacterized membrane protein YfcA
MIPITHIFYSIILGLILGSSFGVFGLFSLTILVVGLPFFGLVTDQKTMLGTIALVSVFPFSAAALYKYNKSGKVNWTVGLIIALSVLIGAYLAATFVLDELRDDDIKFYRFIYITILNISFYYQYFFT